ncbi:hypothetical protein HK105_201479 [Polyrhizophydium stewartii]|uniref:Uncharacterized protein n=1 Tax=Polyrhizophydium stewartii TaxID=2732419 RepID=A0ABR4NIB8_9FUNG
MQAEADGPHRAMVVGISAPQGAGKTTLVRKLVDELAARGLRAAALSTDDGYLPYEQQQAVAAAHAHNPLLHFRGPPGTHDVALIRDVVKALADGRGDGSSDANEPHTVAIPVYDKALRGGRGDRLPERQWRRVAVPLDVVLLEGCHFGFRSIDTITLAALLDADADRGGLGMPAAQRYERRCLLESMTALREYEREWYPLVDSFIHIVADSISNVYAWRWQQEEAMRARLGDPHAGLSLEQVHDFVDRFMPFYELCLTRLTSEGFFGTDPRGGADSTGAGRTEPAGGGEPMPPGVCRHLQLRIDASRALVGACWLNSK